MSNEVQSGGSRWDKVKEIVFLVLGVIHSCACLLVGLALLLDE